MTTFCLPRLRTIRRGHFRLRCTEQGVGQPAAGASYSWVTDWSVASMTIVPECVAKKGAKSVLKSAERNAHAYF